MVHLVFHLDMIFVVDRAVRLLLFVSLPKLKLEGSLSIGWDGSVYLTQHRVNLTSSGGMLTNDNIQVTK